MIVELDSWEFHGGYPEWVSDRDRDGDNLARGGYRTIRIIPERLTDAKAHKLRAILGA